MKQQAQKRTVKDRLKEVLENIDDSIVKRLTNTGAVIMGYKYIYGVDVANTSLTRYAMMVHTGEIPPAETITRAFRQLRRENVSWQKTETKKQEEVKVTMKDAGL